jgi:hypothetical protein
MKGRARERQVGDKGKERITFPTAYFSMDIKNNSLKPEPVL